MVTGINISIKMSAEREAIMSPKELQERHQRARVLKEIDRQVEGILRSKADESSHYERCLNQVQAIQTMYIRENAQLREVIVRLRNEYEQLEGLYLATKGELESSIGVIEKMLKEKKQLQGETAKLKEMVKNQEELLQEYKIGVEEETALQRELLQSQFEEKKAKVEKDFAKALAEMQQQYESKLKRAASHQQLQDYKKQCGKVRHYINENKENMGRGMRKEHSSKTPLSMYSTAQRPQHHNKGVFMD